MTIYTSAKNLLTALQVERSTPEGTNAHQAAKRRTNDAAVDLAGDILAMDRLVALVHEKAGTRPKGEA